MGLGDCLFEAKEQVDASFDYFSEPSWAHTPEFRRALLRDVSDILGYLTRWTDITDSLPGDCPADNPILPAFQSIAEKLAAIADEIRSNGLLTWDARKAKAERN